MQVQPRELFLGLQLELGRQIEDLRQTWVNDARARAWVILTVVAGVSVILLAVIVDALRYLDVHHYRAKFLSLTTDRGLPELVMDTLVLMVAVLTARLFHRTGLRGFLVISALLLLLALDDFFSFHESLGTILVDRLGIVDHGDLKAQPLGELAFLIAFGLFCLPVFLWAVWGMQPDNLAVIVTYGVLFALFAGFSGGVDLLHSMAESSFMDRLMGWIEEGGEILVIIILAAVAILQFRGMPGS